MESAISGNWAVHSVTCSGCSVTQDSTQFYGGANSLKVIVGTGTTQSGASQTLTSNLANSTQYNVSFYAKANSIATLPPVVKAVYSAAGGAESVACSGPGLTLEYRAWQRYTCTFTTPASGNTASAIFIEATAPSQTFYVDNVLVQLSSTADPLYHEGKITLQGVISSPVTIQNTSDSTNAFLVNNKDGDQVLNVDTSDSNNFIDNPSFEVNTDNWAKVGTNTTIARDASQQSYGLSSMKVAGVTTASAGDGATYTIPGGPLTTGIYTLSFSMLSTSVGHGFIQVTYNGATAFCTNSQLTPTPSATQAANVWVRYTCAGITLTSPGSTITISQNDSTVRTYYIDAVQLEDGSTATAYGMGQLSLNGDIVTPTSLKNQSDSTSAFNIQSANGTPVLNVDTADSQLSVRGDTSDGVVNSGTNLKGNLQRHQLEPRRGDLHTYYFWRGHADMYRHKPGDRRWCLSG